MDMPQPHAARRQRQTQEWSGATTAAETIRFSCSICLDGVVEPVVTQCGHLYCWPCLYQWLEPGLLPGERQTLTGTLAVKPVDESRRVCPVCKSPCSTPTLVPIYALVERPREEKEEEDHQQQQQLAGNDPAKKQQRPSKTVSLSNQEENDNDDNSRDRSHRTNATATRTGLRYRSTAMTTTTTTATTTTNSLANPFQNTPPRPAPRRMLHSTVLLTPTANNAANTTTTTSSSSSTTTNNNTMTQPQRPAIGTTSPIGSAFRRPQVPPLHFYGGQDSMQGGAEHSAAAYAQDDPDATEYLSRILLLMGSFVILCLLLF